MSLLSFLGKKKFPVFMVIDVGSHAIRALIFELPEGAKKPVIIKKFFLRLQSASTADRESAGRHTLRISTKLRELLFVALKELGRIPKKIGSESGRTSRRIPWKYGAENMNPRARPSRRPTFFHTLKRCLKNTATRIRTSWRFRLRRF